jgi:quinol monooxygenase YgiN
MLVAIIDVHVKPDYEDSFKTASLDNARNSIKEAGVVRFDVYQQSDDSLRFKLVEIYKTDNDVIRHRETLHYARWRDTVAEMMAEPRTRVTYDIVYPAEAEL